MLLMACHAWAQGNECVRWLERTDVGSPGLRYSHVMAYDSDRGVTVLFGGKVIPLVAYDDTWEYDGIQWRPITIDGPSPDARSHSALCYDTVRHEMVLYGGVKGNGEKLNDTWLYQSNGPGHGIWVQKSGLPVSGTPDVRARAGHAMVFDVRRGVAVMVGGTNSGESGTGSPPDQRVSEVWEWNGDRWNGGYALLGERYEGPTLHAMVYDVDSGTLSISGGGYYYFVRLEYDGWLDVDWSNLTTIYPINESYSYRTQSRGGPFGASIGHRQDHAAAYDSDRRKIVIFGGVALHDSDDGDPGNRLDEAVFEPGDPSTYLAERLFISTPPARQGHKMVYDARRQRMVMFGGIRTGDGGGIYSDTWEYGTGSLPVHYVDAGNFGGQDGSQAQPYRTVRQAASVVGNCTDIISIKSGDYAEGFLLLNNPMRLETRNGTVHIH